MESLRKLLDAKLDVASAEWEQRQLAAIARNIAAGGTGRGVVLTRMEIAASMEQEHVFEADLAASFEAPILVWSSV